MTHDVVPAGTTNAGAAATDPNYPPPMERHVTAHLELEVSATIKVSTLCAGGEHTCAGFTDGTVKCWGANFYGQLGYSSTKNIGDDELPIDTGRSFLEVTRFPAPTAG